MIMRIVAYGPTGGVALATLLARFLVKHRVAKATPPVGIITNENHMILPR